MKKILPFLMTIVITTTTLLTSCNNTRVTEDRLQGSWLSYEVAFQDITLPCGFGDVPYMGFVFNGNTIISKTQTSTSMGTFAVNGNRLTMSESPTKKITATVKMIDNDRFQATFTDEDGAMTVRFKRIE